ncbi:MAG: Cytidylyltransferase family enzyme [Candidatus Methanohalarchaeum thermophilum]|uniref:Cytidylyltransferase family enzyme n=1 Tax=Methanohalarchaeum thermophilum TaxID=1903181 RepID=A0A1Q6DV56_METT1|nr:MAG: Cytidylyltransferase family enzyme [Candidatus Methanohalarchaeum thermophilum]
MAIIAYRFKILSHNGIYLAFVIGIIISLTSGVGWLLILLSFVLAGFLSTRFGIEEKRRRKASEGNNGQRNIKNVFANGLAPLAIAILFWIHQNFFAGQAITRTAVSTAIGQNFYFTAYVGAVAAATSDTLASELGSLDRETRLITNLRKKVKPGSEGGISLIGELSTFIGGLLIGLIAFFLSGQKNILIIAPLAGVLGSHVDSLLGATLETRGVLSNEEVNIISTLFGSISALIMVFV